MFLTWVRLPLHFNSLSLLMYSKCQHQFADLITGNYLEQHHTGSYNNLLLFIHLQPRMLLITCMDSRLCPTSFTQADPGDMFIVRNPGNLMPHNQLFGENHHSVLSERAALELAISSGVEHVAVCGHSDCKV